MHAITIGTVSTPLGRDAAEQQVSLFGGETGEEVPVGAVMLGDAVGEAADRQVAAEHEAVGAE